MRARLAFACLLVLGCGRESTRALEASDPPGLARLAEPLEEVDLGNETRHAACVTPGSSFEIELPSGTRRVLLSTGTRDGPQADVRFELRQGDDAPFWSRAASGEEEGWVDHVIDLAPDGPGTLRFEVTADPPAREGRPACWGSVVLAGDPAPGPPNVVLISLDTLGAPHLASFGHEAETSPRIDAFLAESFSFRRAYVQFANTLTSHRAIFTSRYPSRQAGRSHPAPSLATLLAKRGYLTAGVTEDAYVGSAYGFARGFDRYVDGTGDASTSVWGDARGTFEEAARWLDRIGPETRFFLFVHTYQVHSPYRPTAADAVALANRLTPGDERRFDGQQLAETIIHHNRGTLTVPPADIRRLAALYAGEVRELDAVVGDFLDFIDRTGLANDTLVVLTSDHGEAFGEDGMLGHGKSLHGRVLHVPLGFRWPGHIAAGESERIVQSVDVLPTVLALTGVPAPAGLDGRDLSPRLLGLAPELEPRPAFAEMKSRTAAGPAHAGTPACVGGGSAVFSERFKLFSCRRPSYERLYDLAVDPGETRDVSRGHPEELERLRTLLRAYAAKATTPGGAPGAPEPEVDARTRERLRALGYLE